MTSALGNVNVTGTTLQLGTPPRGAVFTGSVKTQPKGGSFLWVQLIQNETAVLTPITGNVVTCSAGTGLDNVYPYSTGNPTDDNPNLGLQVQYKEETDTFAAQMYLMWSSGLTGSIPVPLGSVTWKWSGDAVQNVTKHTWSEKTGTGTKSAGSFQPSNVSQPSEGFPTWTSVVVNGKCHIQ
jgi:hypothetical protein